MTDEFGNLKALCLLSWGQDRAEVQITLQRSPRRDKLDAIISKTLPEAMSLFGVLLHLFIFFYFLKNFACFSDFLRSLPLGLFHSQITCTRLPVSESDVGAVDL